MSRADKPRRARSGSGARARLEPALDADRSSTDLHGGGGAPLPEIPRKECEAKRARALPPELTALGISADEALGKVALVVLGARHGHPATDEEKRAATRAVNELAPRHFSMLMTILQASGQLEAFMNEIGERNSRETAEHMAVEVQVPAVVFGACSEAQVRRHYAAANQLLEKHHIKITLAGFTDAEKLLARLGSSSKKLLGVSRVVDQFKNPGRITSFWFAEVIRAGSRDYEDVHGRAARQKESQRYRGREAVFLDVNAPGHTLAHELGHILGGSGGEAERANGPGGNAQTGDSQDVMFRQPPRGAKPGELTPEQVRAFKTSIYGHISKVTASSPAGGG